MARRSSTTKSDPTTEATEAPTNTEEVPVTESTTEAPATENTEAAEPTETKAPEAPVDLTAFKAAVEAAVAEADPSTGELPEASLASVLEQYRSIDGVKGKNKAKNELNEGMKSAMNEADIVKARAYLQLSENMTAGSSKTPTEKAPADPTEAAVQRIATLQLARENVVIPEGVSEDLDTKVAELVESSTEAVKSYLAWATSEAEDKGDEPEVPSVVKQAAKLAMGKAAKAGGRTGSTFTGERRDIGKHIAEAFESVESGGFLTVAEIRNFKSSEYGDNPPSAGAISARLFPQGGGKCTVEGIEPGTNDKGNKGATRL